ncbi:MAG: 50S ribosomal protein L11 methyltransferase [Syntrophales bacterium]
MKRFQAITFFLVFFFLAAGISAHIHFQTVPAAEGMSGFTSELPETPRLDVPFVPTSEDVVAEMIRMADVRRDDIVYDLGCGDGRILIAAARITGASGVGVDIDPQRIKESRENAARARVQDRVRFYEQNLFDTDIREASVVMLYLLPDVNIRLRPKLLGELKPGTRIISHNYHMEPWSADRVSRVGMHTIYFWIVPADISGIWKAEVRIPTASVSCIIRFDQEFQKIKGTLSQGKVVMPMKKADLAGDSLSFNIERKWEREVIPVHFEGRVRGNSIQGFLTSPAGPWKGKHAWIAVRNPGSRASLP